MEGSEEYKVYLESTEESGDMKIKYPLYMNCYANALEAMWNNARKNKMASARDIPQGLASNIIAFMGVRGSGKTTALNEFNWILRQYGAYRRECGDTLLPKKRIREYAGWFHVLKSIDASLLEKDEDIIELIWANMYRDFDKMNERRADYRDYRDSRDEAAKAIVGQFDRVYKSYKQSKEKRVMLGDTVLAKLKNLASSLKTKESCDELIGSFLDYMRHGTNEREGDSFLVVTVDDLDLNMESGYRILENLYRYLNNPQVIVLVAADLTQMKTISDKHFIDSLRIEGIKGSQLNREPAERLSSDFLQKVLPLPNRIYMPDNKNILNRTTIVDADRSSLLKPFILGKIAEKMGIYYDAVGLKRHFCVPQTLRELTQYNDFLKTLYDMDGLGGDEEERIRLYNMNHERFNRDINENMAFRILNLEQQKTFRLISGRNIERRAEYAVNFLNNRRNSVTRQEEQQKLSDSVDDQNYCYSDLLEAIYTLGRADYGDKALIHCVLASFTSEMTKEYFDYMHNPSEAARNKAVGRLESFLGNTFGGDWFKNMGAGVVDNTMDYKEPCMLRWVDQGDIGKFKYIYKIKAGGRQKKIRIDFFSKLIPELECVSMLFPSYYDDNGNKIDPLWEMEFKRGTEEESNIFSLEVSVHGEKTKADFDIWGFVGKEMEKDGKSQLRNQTDKIVDSMLGGFMNYQRREGKSPTEQEIETWRKNLLASSIWNGSAEHKIHFPFYNLDLTYNIMKRVRRIINKTEILDKSQILEYLQKVYGHVAYELLREDRFYQKTEETIIKEGHDKDRRPMASHFMEDFVSHPFIKAIGYQYWDRETGEPSRQGSSIDQDRFNELLYTILRQFRPDAAARNKYADAEVK